MGRLNFYKTQANYNSEQGSFKFPTVAYVEETEEVKWMSIRDKYKRAYLTFTALEDGTFTFTMTEKLTTQCVPSISYSLDDGETWATTNNVDNQQIVVTTPTVTSGNKVLWKASAVQFCTNTDSYEGNNMGYGSFTSTGNYNVSGNIMSLLYSDNFLNQTTLPTLITSGYGAGSFGYLFGRSNTKLVSAKNLILPATTLVQSCYEGMFYRCTSLTTAPELNATTLAEWCYKYMFGGCTSLTTAPALPATTLAMGCYDFMFYGCTGLTTAPELPATTLSSYCYEFMFQNCTGLTTAPELPATTLAQSCYLGMFQGCTSLTTAPVLPATTLVDSCYDSMFFGCTALTKAPVLPATTLTNNCYQWMFRGCTSLTTAPVLPATTLARHCYESMFQNCSLLNYIKAMFTTTPSNTYTQNWVQGVAATGTFVKNSAANWTTTGENGVPSGWTVETASE